MSWWDLAACRGRNAELWYPSVNVEPVEAKAVCAECPVRADCLEHALVSGEDDGVWGGLTRNERKKLRRIQRNGHEADVAVYLPG